MNIAPLSERDNEDLQAVRALRAELDGTVLIAAHHYQRPEIAALADILGDSYKLAVQAAERTEPFVILAGVRFMAESAAVYAGGHQTVLLTDHAAGCPMADMIDSETAESVLTRLEHISGPEVIPVTYMNSWNATKAFTGLHGGSICTSGNARAVLSHYLENGNRIFFMPDYNLGMNTARALGLHESEICVIARDGSFKPSADPRKARIFLWDGFCHVHTVFSVTDITAARTAVPGIKIIVHPECSPDVVAAADDSGSTEGLYRMLEAAPAGSSWAVGTEARFVDRMIALFPDKQIIHLKHSLCPNMARTNPANLKSALEAVKRHLATGERLPAITVPEQEREDARHALDAMVTITNAQRT